MEGPASRPDPEGFLNRRFKRVFGYFCRGAKVPEGSGGEKPPGYHIDTAPPRPAGGGKIDFPVLSKI